MELTKEQQRIINKYRVMPSFLQRRNFDSIIYELQKSGLSTEETTYLLFQNSSKSVKIKYIDKFVRDMWDNNEAYQEVIDIVKKLPIHQQDRILQNASDFTLTLLIGNVSPKIQEKYFHKFLSSELSMYHIGDLNPEIRKLHEEEILSGPRANAQALNDMWDILSPESKSKYFDLYLQPGLLPYSIAPKWGELNEEGQEKHITKILELYESKQCEFDANMWAYTKGNVQSQYLSAFINAIRKNEKKPADILRRLWEKTADKVQNSADGRTFIDGVSVEERIQLFLVSNSKLQSELLAQDIRKYINSEYDSNSPLAQDLIHTKDKVFEMNFQNLFEIIKPNVNYLYTFLGACPDEVKEKYSSVIEKYFSSNLEFFINSRNSLQDMLIQSANYLNVRSISNIIENIFSSGLENANKELTYTELVKRDLESFPVVEAFWNSIKIEKQRDIYSDYIENGRLKEHINTLFNLMNFENFEDAKKYFAMYFEKYNPEKKDIAISRLEKIFAKNNSIVSTINFEFVASDLMDSLTEEQLLRITHYPKVQEELAKNKDNKSFIDAFASLLKTGENWTLAADCMFKNIDERQYDELLLNIKENAISPEYYENLCIVLSKPNYFGIKSKEDVEKYFDVDGKRMQMLLSIMRGENVELPDSLKALSKEELKKFAISEYLYGMDLEALNKYEIRFKGVHGLDTEDSEYIKQLVAGISGLNNANEGELDQIVEGILEGKILPTEYAKDIHLDSKAINLFRKAFEKGVYNPKDSEKDQVEPIIYNGSSINVHRVHDDFKMLVRVEGAYRTLQDAPDYRQYYDNPNISAHGNCESVIGQDQIGLARNTKGNIVVGYSYLPPNSLLISAPYDLGTENKSFAPLHDKLRLDFRFNGLQETVDNTRHTHNETVMERLIVDENGNVQKLRPSYLLWVEDRKTDKFPPEFTKPPEDNEDAMLKYEAKVHLWEETQRAAQELGLPIVIINREECAEKETEKLDHLQRIIKGEVELPAGKSLIDIAREAIVKFENNAVGLEFAEPDIQAKYFTQAQRENLMFNIMCVLERIPDIAYEERHEYLRQVTEIIQQESSKFSADGIKPDEKIREYYETKAKLLEDELLRYEEYIGTENDIVFTIPDEIKQVFETDIRTIAGTDYYDQNKAHSIEHIEKVMFFSLMLAKNEGFDQRDIRTLLAAAAFHDSYRAGNDGREEHAVGSAEKAKAYFESDSDNGYGVDSTDIPLIQVAIAYHEYPEEVKGKVDREKISKLCEEYGYTGDFEKAVQISTLLKDADALDRERFETRGKLNPEYLRTETAKSRRMILFAQKVNGVYAKRMIERNYEEEGQVDKFNAVRVLQSKRKNNSIKVEDKITESPLSVDEMLELFEEIVQEYTQSPSDVDKKKGVIRAFGESGLTGEEIAKAKEMLGIETGNRTAEPPK